MATVYCAWHKSTYIIYSTHPKGLISHGICKECKEKYFADQLKEIERGLQEKKLKLSTDKPSDYED